METTVMDEIRRRYFYEILPMLEGGESYRAIKLELVDLARYAIKRRESIMHSGNCFSSLLELLVALRDNNEEGVRRGACIFEAYLNKFE